MQKILGLDISSSCIGWGLLEVDEISQKINYIDSGIIIPIKGNSILERLIGTRDQISELFSRLNPDLIGIEDIISFMRNKSTANTVITLAVFNRMIGLLAFDKIKKIPKLFSVLDIRHNLKVGKVFPKKEDMPELVAKHLGVKFPYIYNTRGKYKNNPHRTSYDRADGIAVSLHYALTILNKDSKKRKKK